MTYLSDLFIHAGARIATNHQLWHSKPRTSADKICVSAVTVGSSVKMNISHCDIELRFICEYEKNQLRLVTTTEAHTTSTAAQTKTAVLTVRTPAPTVSAHLTTTISQLTQFPKLLSTGSVAQAVTRNFSTDAGTAAPQFTLTLQSLFLFIDVSTPSYQHTLSVSMDKLTETVSLVHRLPKIHIL